MGQWIIVAFSKHPDVGSVVNIKPGADSAANNKMVELFEALVFERCLEETKAALQEDGSNAFEVAFSAVGQIAAIELMQNKVVNAYIHEFSDGVDHARFDELRKQ